jgi:cytochrome P450
MSELIGWDSTGMLGVAGPRWRATRKVLQRFLNKTAVVQYYPMIESNARVCARSIIENPDSLFGEIRL